MSRAAHAAGLVAGRAAGLLSGVEEALALAGMELALAPSAFGRPVVGSNPERFQTAIRSRSSDVSVAAFFMRRCFFLFSFLACDLAADTCF